MKKYRICFEIEGLAEDEIGNPYPGGLCLTLGEDTDPEATPEEYAELVDHISIEGVLKAAMLDGLYTAADCRLISPEEYNRKYGEGEDTYGNL